MASAVYRPAKGAKSDVDKVFKEFTSAPSVRYEAFNRIWKLMNFNLIYSGRQNSRECREFAEECFHIVLTNYLTASCTFQLQVGALYMLYSLYFAQPIDPPAKVRVTHEQWSLILKVMQEAHEQEHLDLEFTFNMLKAYRAFTFVATAHRSYPTMSMATHVSTVDEEESKEGFQILGVQDEQSVLSEILEPQYIEQLSEIHEQYHRMKCLLSGETRPTTSMNMIHTDIVQYITRSIGMHEIKRKKIIGSLMGRKRRDSQDHITTSESEADSDQDSTYRSSLSSPDKKSPEKDKDVGKRRSELKKKAFSDKTVQAKGRRHRQEKSTMSDLVSDVDSEAAGSKPKKSFQTSKKMTKKKKEPVQGKRHIKVSDTMDDVRDLQVEEEVEDSLSSSSSSPNKRVTRKKVLLFPEGAFDDNFIDDSDQDEDFVASKAKMFGISVKKEPTEEKSRKRKAAKGSQKKANTPPLVEAITDIKSSPQSSPVRRKSSSRK